MRKLLIFGIIVVMLFSLAACVGEEKAIVEDDKMESFSNIDVGDPDQDDIPSAVIDEARDTSGFKDGVSNQEDTRTVADAEAGRSSDFKVNEPNRESAPAIATDKADGTSNLKVDEPNWND